VLERWSYPTRLKGENLGPLSQDDENLTLDVECLSAIMPRAELVAAIAGLPVYDPVAREPPADHAAGSWDLSPDAEDEPHKPPSTLKRLQGALGDLTRNFDGTAMLASKRTQSVLAGYEAAQGTLCRVDGGGDFQVQVHLRLLDYVGRAHAVAVMTAVAATIETAQGTLAGDGGAAGGASGNAVTHLLVSGMGATRCCYDTFARFKLWRCGSGGARLVSPAEHPETACQLGAVQLARGAVAAPVAHAFSHTYGQAVELTESSVEALYPGLWTKLDALDAVSRYPRNSIIVVSPFVVKGERMILGATHELKYPANLPLDLRYMECRAVRGSVAARAAVEPYTADIIRVPVPVPLVGEGPHRPPFLLVTSHDVLRAVVATVPAYADGHSIAVWSDVIAPTAHATTATRVAQVSWRNETPDTLRVRSRFRISPATGRVVCDLEEVTEMVRTVNGRDTEFLRVLGPVGKPVVFFAPDITPVAGSGGGGGRGGGGRGGGKK
jgi:hypothetical protein